VLNWAVRSAASDDTLMSFLAGTVRPEHAIVRFEPALDRAAALARGFDLLQWQNRYWILTNRGRKMLDDVDANYEVLADEKALLAQLPGPLSQAAVHRLLAREAG
jgi:hypothetical protein